MPTVCFCKDRLLVFFGEGEGGFPLGREFTPLVASYQTQICARAIKRSYKLLLLKKKKKFLDPKGNHSKFFRNPCNKSDLYINRFHKLGMSLGCPSKVYEKSLISVTLLFFQLALLNILKEKKTRLAARLKLRQRQAKRWHSCVSFTFYICFYLIVCVTFNEWTCKTNKWSSECKKKRRDEPTLNDLAS